MKHGTHARLSLARPALTRKLAINTFTHAVSLRACEQVACAYCTRCWLVFSLLFSHCHACLSLTPSWRRACPGDSACAGVLLLAVHLSIFSLPARTCTCVCARGYLPDGHARRRAYPWPPYIQAALLTLARACSVVECALELSLLYLLHLLP